MTRPFFLFLLFLFLVFSDSAHALTFSDRVQVHSPSRVPPLVFEDANGAQHSLSEYKGRFILLNVWATWCAPCVQEMPSLDVLQTHFDPKHLLVLPMSEDRGDSVVNGFYKTHAINHVSVAIDHAGMAPSSLHMDGLPTTLLINPDGQEIARIEGDANWASPEVIDYLRGQLH